MCSVGMNSIQLGLTGLIIKCKLWLLNCLKKVHQTFQPWWSYFIKFTIWYQLRESPGGDISYKRLCKVQDQRVSSASGRIPREGVTDERDIVSTDNVKRPRKVEAFYGEDIADNATTRQDLKGISEEEMIVAECGMKNRNKKINKIQSVQSKWKS